MAIAMLDWRAFGRLIYEYRRAHPIDGKPMSQQEFGKRCGLAKTLQGKISLIERGMQKHPAYESVQAIKRLLRLDKVPGED